MSAEVRNIARGVLLMRDLQVTMSDGRRLAANVFCADPNRAAPVIVSVTPYGKDALPGRVGMLLMRLSGVRFGTLDRSRWTGFEAPDPLYWVRAGYTVVQADVRGMHASEGYAGVLTTRDAADYAELIGWAARQAWSSGRVALLGVSYLAMSQWRVAALRPPELAAIVPWEGVTDLLREFGYQDGVVETGFVGVWWRFRMRRGRNRRFGLVEDFPRERDRHPFDDDYWAAKRPDLAAIDVPALVCASWSDQGLHTRGSLAGFEAIGSREKWLFTHGRRKWETFYSPDARETQRRFLDRFVKGERNGWDDEPRVRLEVRRSRDAFDVRAEPSWPLATVTYVPLYLDADSGRLSETAPRLAGCVTFRARGRRPQDRASFLYRFDGDAELTGGMTLKLWMSTSAGRDLDVFVVLRKYDAEGREVFFYGYNGFARDGVAKGWLRASHRELDRTKSRPGRPYHTHALAEPVRTNEIVPLEIEVLPSSTHFERGSVLRLDVLGRDAAGYPAFRHGRSVNRGRHTVHTGGGYDAYLLAPFVGRNDPATR